MKLSTTAHVEGTMNSNPIGLSADPAVQSKLVSLMAASLYTRKYKPIMEVYLNAREAVQTTVRDTGSTPRKTYIKLPFGITEKYTENNSNTAGVDGVVFANPEDGVTVHGGQEWHDDVAVGDTTVEIRNYGESMTPEQAASHLTQAGVSSKSDSDDFGGGWALVRCLRWQSRTSPSTRTFTMA